MELYIFANKIYPPPPSLLSVCTFLTTQTFAFQSDNLIRLCVIVFYLNAIRLIIFMQIAEKWMQLLHKESNAVRNKVITKVTQQAVFISMLGFIRNNTGKCDQAPRLAPSAPGRSGHDERNPIRRAAPLRSPP